MNFLLIDRITGWESGKWLEAEKTVSLSEEYLFDHFPDFPVMPGVLMLECLVQAGSWLLRLSSGKFGLLYFLRSVKALRYGNFVKPGDRMSMRVQLIESDGEDFLLKGKGTVGLASAVAGRFVLAGRSPVSGIAERELEDYYRLMEDTLFRKGGAITL